LLLIAAIALGIFVVGPVGAAQSAEADSLQAERPRFPSAPT
jgi:hypothetical protein